MRDEAIKEGFTIHNLTAQLSKEDEELLEKLRSAQIKQGDLKPLKVQNMWEEMMQELDEDGDGKISYEEFKKNMMKMIDKGNYKLRPRTLESK